MTYISNDFNAKKSGLDLSLGLIEQNVKAIDAEKISHTVAISLLQEMNDLYAQKLIPLQKASKDLIKLGLPNKRSTELELSYMEEKVVKQFTAIEDIWKKHTSNQSFLEYMPSLVTDIAVKNTFNFNLSQVQKATLKKTYSNSSSYSGPITPDILFFPFQVLDLVAKTAFLILTAPLSS